MVESVTGRSWSQSVQAEVAARLSRPDLGAWLGQVAKVRHCSHPVRLSGTSDTINPVTGEVLVSYASSSEPDGVTYVRCGNRRASVCPSCSHEYKGDVWHVLMAGAAGGMKDVPDAVAQHPLVFATFTAPSLGLVHAAKKPSPPGTQRCLPRSGSRRQWWAPELWRRFTITLKRRLAAHLGLSEHAAKQLVLVQFAKVAEFQRRGVIHFHALVRLDGPSTDTDGYPASAVDVTSTDLAGLIRSATAAVWFDAPPVDRDDTVRRLRFGAQVDARPVTGTADRAGHAGPLHPETVAAYIAKYATKASADLPTDGGPNAHLRRLRGTVQHLAQRAAIAGLSGRDEPYRGWGRWVDMLGFRGHLATKSRRYSTTLGRIRRARHDWTRRQHLPRYEGRSVEVDQDQADGEGTTLAVGSWRFVGMGWLNSGDAALAAASAARARDD